MRADMTIGPLRVDVERGYKARALDAGAGQVLIQVVREGDEWPSKTPLDLPPVHERVGFAGAAALAVPVAKGAVKVVKVVKDAELIQRAREGLAQRKGDGAGVVVKLRERLARRPGRVVKLRGPFSIAGCCAKCGGGQ